MDTKSERKIKDLCISSYCSRIVRHRDIAERLVIILFFVIISHLGIKIEHIDKKMHSSLIQNARAREFLVVFFLPGSDKELLQTKGDFRIELLLLNINKRRWGLWIPSWREYSYPHHLPYRHNVELSNIIRTAHNFITSTMLTRTWNDLPKRSERKVFQWILGLHCLFVLLVSHRMMKEKKSRFHRIRHLVAKMLLLSYDVRNTRSDREQ